MELVPLLKNSLLFSGLNDQDLASLAAITVRRSFAKGETLFSEGEEAAGFYLLVSKGSPRGYELVTRLNQVLISFQDSGYSVEEIIGAGVKIARKAVEGTDALVALDIGPIGQLLEPAG